MPVKIEKNIPVPEKYGKYSSYPFGQMKVGDSFVIEESHDVQGVRAAASHFKRRAQNTVMFSIRKIDGGRFRCWRTE